MKTWTFAAVCAALALNGCQITPNAKDIELTNTGALLGIEACERQATTGETLEQALGAVAGVRRFHSYSTSPPGSGLIAPNWKLEGLVWVGASQPNNSCTVFSMSGSGEATRDAIVAMQLAKTNRKWSRMRIIDPKPGDARDAVCTTDDVGEGKSIAVVMTTNLKPGLTERRFIASVVPGREADCTSRRL